MTAVLKKIRSYKNWGQAIEIEGISTLNPDDPKEYVHINRTRIRRELFLEPLLRSGALRGKRVLDLGCSYGYWAMAAAAEGGAAFVLGVDALPRSIEQGRWIIETKKIPNCELKIGDSYKILSELEAGSFDIVFCLGFFYHIRDPYLLLAMMRKVAKQFVIVDTMVHKSEDAIISVRPVRHQPIIEESKLALELFSSPKALYWLAYEAGYAATVKLTTNLERDKAGILDYCGGQRATFALFNRPELRTLFDNAEDLPYLTPAEDFKKYGVYPELRGGRKG